MSEQPVSTIDELDMDLEEIQILLAFDWVESPSESEVEWVKPLEITEEVEDDWIEVSE